MSEEGFFPRGSVLSSLRYRLAYGSSGVQPDPIASLPQLALSTVFVNGSTASAARLDALGNPDLKSERSTEVETGLDIELFDSRLALEGTFYYRKSTDALVRRSMPRSIGILGPGRLENIGEVRNSGWEVSLDATIINSDAFTFQMLLNGSINSNELTKLESQVTPPEDRFIKFVEGYPLFGQWDRKLISYDDANGDGVLQDNEVVIGDSIEFLGVPNPTDIFNATPVVSLFSGRLQLTSLFEYRGGWIQTNFTELNKCNIGACRARNDPEATIDDQARYIGFRQPGFSYDPYAQDGTFLRWREASISYRVPDNILSGLGLNSLLLTVSGRNLHVWTGYDGVDPEVTANPSLAGNFGTIWDLGYDNPVSPPSRYWIFRVTAGF